MRCKLYSLRGRLTCQTPTMALAIRIRRMTKGSTNAVTWSSDSSNHANTYMHIIHSQSTRVMPTVCSLRRRQHKRTSSQNRIQQLCRSSLLSVRNVFKTNDLQTITECQSYFGFQLPSVRLSERSKRFDDKYSAIHCSLC